MLANNKKQIQAKPVETKFVEANKDEVLRVLNKSNKKNHVALSLLAK
jgi:hypothetical protein